MYEIDGIKKECWLKVVLLLLVDLELTLPNFPRSRTVHLELFVKLSLGNELLGVKGGLDCFSINTRRCRLVNGKRI